MLSMHAQLLDSAQFITCLGMKDTWQFRDVYGLDPELLSMVPRPVCALLLLFPVTEKVRACFGFVYLHRSFIRLLIINTLIMTKLLCIICGIKAFCNILCISMRRSRKKRKRD